MFAFFWGIKKINTFFGLRCHLNGWMAERSKALVSGTSLFGGEGSNPSPIIFLIFFFPGKESFCRRDEFFRKVRRASPACRVPTAGAFRALEVGVSTIHMKQRREIK